jgi:predicted ester cyclase
MHSINYDPPPGFPNTVEGAKQLHAMLFAALSDLQMTIQDMAAEGDKIWTRKTASGTHQGELFGVPATGKRVVWEIIDVVTLSRGRSRSIGWLRTP